MNFDIVEGLSEEEVLRLYDNDIVDGLEDGVYTGFCGCSTGSGHMAFGVSGAGTYCGLQLTTQQSCQRWCARHGFSLFFFSQNCTCRATGGTSGWGTCRV